ncbi:hypothetical protein [Burkholderia vietnamiensis]|uniref:hypothetical protein n=1 Tax=Burkholderia vietnamiensis TaxID=60552 RepID=UPI0020133C0F|nr:hypothetical protein [Burkholderia vietnamiensis]
MLLPLPAALIQDISLENHLVLTTLRTGHGTAQTLVALLLVIYTTFYLLDKDHSEADLNLFLKVEAALDACIQQATDGLPWQLQAEQWPPIERVLLRFDEVVASVPQYRYEDACERLHRFVALPTQSPLPGSRIVNVWS